MRTLIILSTVLLAIVPAIVQRQPVHSCVVVLENDASQRWAGSGAECATRLSPASTYKIPHALVGLETGVVTIMTEEKWDGVPRSQQPQWNVDHTVLSAMRPSVLWFFQRMAPKIGAARARQWLQRFNYGNADTSGSITEYWVNGRLRISPDEQLAFLKQFYDATLPVSRRHLDNLREAMEQDAGTVENARGIYKLDAPWRPGITLNAKTGASSIAGAESVSWLVGQLTVDGRPLVFASAVWSDGGVDPLDATRLAIKTFVDRKVLSAK